MGRWCYVQLVVKNGQKITFIVLCRVCNQNVRSAGGLTATRQQLKTLEMLIGPTDSTKLTHPRTQCIQDIRPFIMEQQQAGNLVYLGADYNETPSEGRNKNGTAKLHSSEAFMEACNREDIFHLHRENTPATTAKLAHRYMDRIAVSRVKCDRTGILPILIRKDSDHRAFYIDINAETLFTTKTSPLAKFIQRRLTIGNQVTCDSYIECGTQ